jgi:hypothetical protein
LTRFDIAAEADGPMKAVVKEFRGVQVKDKLTLTFAAHAGEPFICGLAVIAAQRGTHGTGPRGRRRAGVLPESVTEDDP